MTEDADIYDVVIIGGGPAGLTAAQYASRAKLKTVVLDKSSTAGALAFTGHIENYPGLLAPMSGKELLDLFRKQAVDFGAEYRGETQVVGVSLADDIKEVYTMDKTFRGKSVIIATGSMGRKATIAGEAEFLGRGVSYCAVCDAAFFKGRDVCVLGDSEEAVKEAVYLTRFAARVCLVGPGKQLAVEPDYPGLDAPNLTVVLHTRVTAIEGGETVERIRTKTVEGVEGVHDVAGVFVYIQGNRPIVDFLGGTAEISENECLVSNRMMGTSLRGVFAAGDVTCTEVRQVVIAAAHGCVAALSAEMFLHHRGRRRYDWG
jgi:thioredoxin reductase (NADPH)